MKRKPRLLMHLAHGGLVELLARFYQACREFIDVVINGNAVLAYQNNFVALFPVQTVHQHAVRHIFSCFDLHLLDGFCAGSHVIAEVMVYFVCSFHQVKIYERIFRLFCDFFNIRHK